VRTWRRLPQDSHRLPSFWFRFFYRPTYLLLALLGCGAVLTAFYLSSFILASLALSIHVAVADTDRASSGLADMGQTIVWFSQREYLLGHCCLSWGFVTLVPHVAAEKAAPLAANINRNTAYGCNRRRPGSMPPLKAQAPGWQRGSLYI